MFRSIFIKTLRDRRRSMIWWVLGALAIGAATGRRGTALGVSSGVALVAFLIQTLAPIVDWLEPVHPLTPFYYYGENQPLVNGLHWGHAGVLVGLSALFVLIALFTFRRRDIRV